VERIFISKIKDGKVKDNFFVMNQKTKLMIYLLLAILSVIAVVWFVRDNKGNSWSTSPSNPPSGSSLPSESQLTQEIMAYLRKLNIPNMPSQAQISEAAKYLRKKYCPSSSSPSSPSYPSKDQLKQDLMNYLKSKGITTVTPTQIAALTDYLSGKYCPSCPSCQDGGSCPDCQTCDNSPQSSCGPLPETFSVRYSIYPDQLYDAGAVCAALGANVATKAQVQDAYDKGASWCIAGAVADDSTKSYFPLNNNANCSYKPENFYAMNFNPQGEMAVNCYGIKPSAQNVNVFTVAGSPSGSVAYFNDATAVWSVNDL